MDTETFTRGTEAGAGLDAGACTGGVAGGAAASATGYLSADYVGSLAEFGRPLALPASGGWLLRRPIAPASGAGALDQATDAMGPYPLFCCRDWRALRADLDGLGAIGDASEEAPVSLVVVTDPFGDHRAAELAACFPDRVVPFKEHFVVDLSRPLASFVSAHHRRYASANRREVDVEPCRAPLDWLDDWCRLYEVLIARHGIRGLPALSRAAFARQLAVPGIEAFRASRGGVTAGMLLWYRQGEVAYYHLAAYSEEGYHHRASFPLFWLAFEQLAAAGVRWLSLGAGASVPGAGAGSGGPSAGQAGDGLVRFKSGWSTGTRTTYLCGRIFRPHAYAALVKQRGLDGSAYFPAYRHGELA
jgi:hypothetical protein